MNNGFLRVAAAAPEIRVADVEYNVKHIVSAALKANKAGAELIAFPELCVTGCTCGDLFMQSTLLQSALKGIFGIAERTKESDALIFVGAPLLLDGSVYNCCVAIYKGEILGITPKSNFSSAGELNQRRHFSCGENSTVTINGNEYPFGKCVYVCGDITVAAEIGEDMFSINAPSYDCGALINVNVAADCETVNAADVRKTVIKAQSLRTVSAYIYSGAGYGESTTDLVFSAHSLIVENGEVLSENAPFEYGNINYADIDTDYLLYERIKQKPEFSRDEAFAVNFELKDGNFSGLKRNVSRLPFVPYINGDEKAELILKMQTEGLVKRMEHIGAEKLVLGVSGGLDSTLALLVCVRALKRLNKPSTSLSAISMPCFGTSEKTASGASRLAKNVGADYRIIDIKGAVTQHLKDIGHDLVTLNSAYENAQARMRTMVLTDIANGENGLVVGTGDLSEEALGWCTYGGDHLSMYSVNASVPKTLVKHLVAYEAKRLGGEMSEILNGVLSTDISPELLPANNGEISQKTEDIIGAFELNDFFLYYTVFRGCPPQKTLAYAAAAFGGAERDYKQALKRFYKRFFSSQFKRSCSPDGVKTGFSLSPRGDFVMPSDACVKNWIKSLE